MSIETVTTATKTGDRHNPILFISLILSVLALILSIYLYGKFQTLDTVGKRSYLKNRGRIEKLEREVIYLHSKENRGANNSP